MRKFWMVIAGASVFLPAPAQIVNIKLIDQAAGTAPAINPTVAINHKELDNWVVGVAPNSTLYTRDGGKTWRVSTPESSSGNYGDPALIADGRGNFHYWHEAGPGGKSVADSRQDRIVSRTSSDGGSTWDAESPFGIRSPYDQVRPRPGVSRGSLYVTWSRFDHQAQTDSTCQSNILLSMSSSDGRKWSEPIQINQTPGDCDEGARTMQGAAPAINTEGKLFVAWSNRGVIFLDRSYDGGKTWLSNDLAIGRHPGGGRIMVPGIQRCYSMPVLAVDNSLSYFRGSLYLVWADQSNGENDTDIWFMRSTNRGDLWTQPRRVNLDSLGKHQFLPSIAVDETTGILYIVYYDRRAYDDLRTDVYLAYSMDGGIKFTEVKISESPFVPVADKPFTDHIAIAAFKGVIAPVWTRMDDGSTSVWTALLKQGDLIKKADVPRLQQLRRK
jgi:hypothetical protein